MALRFGCSLCGCNEPRAGCPKCEERQPSLFRLPPPPPPDDADTVTLGELREAARREKSLHEARIARLAGLGRPVRIGLVGCAKTKRNGPALARDLYKSPLFVAALRHAEASCDETFVVSAAHGLVALDETLQSYDRSLRELGKKERLAWGSRLAGALNARFEALPLHLFIFAGLEYAGPIEAAARPRSWTVEAPLARKAIGQRLVWLREQNTVTPCRKRRRSS